MPRSKAVLVPLQLTVVSLCLAASLSSPSTLLAAAAKSGGKPLVTPITKDPATSLYTSPLKDTRPLVLDLSAPLISLSTCDSHPTLSANATDGKNPLYPVSFPAAASCAPPKLPAGAVGVAGLASSRVALPAQVARTQHVATKLMLCLPRGGAGGVAIFGGGPLFLMTSTVPPVELAVDLTSTLTYTPLLNRRDSHSYYLPVKVIAIDQAQVRLPLATGGVALATTVPYTALRPDVYRPLADAFDKALTLKWNSTKKVKAVPPFELCYDSKTLPGPTRIGWLVPDIDLMLEGGRNWTFSGSHSMVDVNNFTAACFGFVEMKPADKKGGYGGGAPAVVIGGFQMENHVLQFDLDKKLLGFAKLQISTSCSNFNFTRSQLDF